MGLQACFPKRAKLFHCAFLVNIHSDVRTECCYCVSLSKWDTTLDSSYCEHLFKQRGRQATSTYSVTTQTVCYWRSDVACKEMILLKSLKVFIIYSCLHWRHILLKSKCLFSGWEGGTKWVVGHNPLIYLLFVSVWMCVMDWSLYKTPGCLVLQVS